MDGWITPPSLDQIDNTHVSRPFKVFNFFELNYFWRLINLRSLDEKRLKRKNFQALRNRVESRNELDSISLVRVSSYIACDLLRI